MSPPSPRHEQLTMSAEDKVAFGDEKQGHDVEAVAQVISAGNEEDDIVEFDEKKDLKCVSSAKEPRPHSPCPQAGSTPATHPDDRLGRNDWHCTCPSSCLAARLQRLTTLDRAYS